MKPSRAHDECVGPHVGPLQLAPFLPGRMCRAHPARRSDRAPRPVRIIIEYATRLGGGQDAHARENATPESRRLIHRHRETATQARHCRLDHCLHRCRGEICIDSTAATLQRGQSGFGRQRMRGGDHPFAADRRNTRRIRPRRPHCKCLVHTAPRIQINRTTRRSSAEPRRSDSRTAALRPADDARRNPTCAA